MVSYYKLVENIAPGWLAKSTSINSIQNNVIEALSQLIMENFGIAYIMDDSENAFKMTPAITIYDQVNENGTAWKSLEQLYLCQRIDILKSSIRKIILKFKNETNTAKTVEVILKEVHEDIRNGAEIAKKEISINPGINEYEIDFNLHHLHYTALHLIIKRTNESGVYVYYDENGTYNGSLAESIDDYTYNEIGGDLWFKTIYANERTFDIQRGFCMIMGDKFFPITTHVTIPPGSYYGPRIDFVCVTPDYIIEVIPGDPAYEPKPPYHKVPYNYLKIAEVYVPKNASHASQMRVNQNDFIGEYRLRGHHERIRRLEKWANWMFKFNSPARIKYTLSGDVFKDDTESFGVCYDEQAGGYVLCVTEGVEAPDYTVLQEFTQNVKFIWDLSNEQQLDLQRSNNIDINYQQRVAKPMVTTKTYTVYEKETHTETVTKTQTSEKENTFNLPKVPPTNIRTTFDHATRYYSNSTFVGAFFYAPISGILKSISIGPWKYKNAYSYNLILYKVDEENQRLRELHRSPTTKLNPETVNNWVSITGDFLGKKYWIEPGWYAIVLLLHPNWYHNDKRCDYWNNPWQGNLSDRITPIPQNYQGYKEAVFDIKIHGYYQDGGTGPGLAYGDIPMPRADKWQPQTETFQDIYKKNKMPPHLYRAYKNAMDIKLVILTTETTTITENVEVSTDVPITVTQVEVNPGVIHSDIKTTDYNIRSGEIKANVTLPGNSRYLIEVSNDGGQTYINAMNEKFEFPTLGNQFCWRITLYPGSNNELPTLSYSDILKFAVQATLNYVGVQEVTVDPDYYIVPPSDGTSGCLVTPPFTGDDIINLALETLELKKFSHWEWVRLWAIGPRTAEEETDSFIRVYIENGSDLDDDEKVIWDKIISGLRLGDMFHGSVDYSHYEGSYEEDEYNEYLGLDPEILEKKVTIKATEETYEEPQKGFMEVIPVDGSKFKDAKYISLKLHYTPPQDKPLLKVRAGQLKLIIAKDPNGANIIDEHDLPAISNPNRWIHTFVKLRYKYYIEEAKYIIIKNTLDLPGTIKIKDIYLQKNLSYPLFGKYIRLRVCMGRRDLSIESPVIRKVGLIPITV